MMIYLAGPFFKPEQVRVIERLENSLERFPDLIVYSPRKDGVIMNMSVKEKMENSKKIFATNVARLSEANMTLAVIDGRDVGTTWELGFAYCMKHLLRESTIVTYTDENYGLNVMIQECVDSHLRGMEQADRFIEAIAKGDPKAYSMFRNFEPAAT